MAKTKLKFDAAQLKDFCSIYEEQPMPDGFGGTSGMGWVLIASPRCKMNIKTNTSQMQEQGGSWGFYQVYEFVIRTNQNYNIEKDMELRSNGVKYVIRGVAPSETNPRYTIIYTETKQ